MLALLGSATTAVTGPVAVLYWAGENGESVAAPVTLIGFGPTDSQFVRLSPGRAGDSTSRVSSASSSSRRAYRFFAAAFTPQRARKRSRRCSKWEMIFINLMVRLLRGRQAERSAHFRCDGRGDRPMPGDGWVKYKSRLQ